MVGYHNLSKFDASNIEVTDQVYLQLSASVRPASMFVAIQPESTTLTVDVLSIHTASEFTEIYSVIVPRRVSLVEIHHHIFYSHPH